jgi:hypothetical protein
VAAPIESGECCGATPVFEEAFDGATVAVQTSVLSGPIGWRTETHRASSPPSSLYFGDPATRTYDFGERVAAAAEFGPVDLPEDQEVTARFAVLLGIEPGRGVDQLTLEADLLARDGEDADTALETILLWRKHDLPDGESSDAFDDEFEAVEVPLAGMEGKRVRLRFVFDSVDELNNGLEGVYLDDVAVTGGCPLLPECSEDAECTPADPECGVGICSAEGYTEADFCAAEEEFLEGIDDGTGEGDPCLADDAPEACCSSDADCDDGDPTTVDTCEGASCVHVVNPDACAADADCDDGDACTADRCDEGLCLHEGALGAGCCVPADAPLADFDRGRLQGVFVTDNLETGVFWGVDRTRSTSGDYSLYCGDPVEQTYAHDVRVKSSATTPLFSVPPGGRTHASADVYKATRRSPGYDVLAVYVLKDGVLRSLWSSRELADGTTAGAWQHLALPLDDYAGQDIQLRFVFDSVNAPAAGVAGTFEGAYLDSLRVTTVCE